MDCSTLGLPAYFQLPELAQTHVHWVSDAIQPSHPLSSPSPPTFNLSSISVFFNENSHSVQFRSVTQSCPTFCDSMDCSTPGITVHHQLPEFMQIHVHWVSDIIQPFQPLSSPSVPTFNLSQNQGLFQWVSSSHQVAKLSEFQFQHQSFRWIFRVYFL